MPMIHRIIAAPKSAAFPSWAGEGEQMAPIMDGRIRECPIPEVKDVAPLLGPHGIDGKHEYQPAQNHSGQKLPCRDGNWTNFECKGDV
jgi:hypothetical protein